MANQYVSLYSVFMSAAIPQHFFRCVSGSLRVNFQLAAPQCDADSGLPLKWTLDMQWLTMPAISDKRHPILRVDLRAKESSYGQMQKKATDCVSDFFRSPSHQLIV